jgi:hypothetical protein
VTLLVKTAYSRYSLDAPKAFKVHRVTVGKWLRGTHRIPGEAIQIAMLDIRRQLAEIDAETEARIKRLRLALAAGEELLAACEVRPAARLPSR